MVDSLNNVQEQQRRLINITADGIIDDSEIEDFVSIQEELEKISITVEALQLWSEQMLALSNLTDEQVVEETERCYRMLKPEFFSGNAVQSLSHVLALSEGRADDKCKATLQLFRDLKAKGCKYGTDYELPPSEFLPCSRQSIMQWRQTSWRWINSFRHKRDTA